MSALLLEDHLVGLQPLKNVLGNSSVRNIGLAEKHAITCFSHLGVPRIAKTLSCLRG